MSEDDASDLVLFVAPSAATARSGETIYFDIEARTIHDRIDLLEIGSFDRQHGMQTLAVLEPRSRSYSDRYFYDVPNLTVDLLDIELSFRAVDDRGNVQTQNKVLTAIGDTSLLPEKSGITLYSPYSGKADGLSLRTCQPLLCAVTPEEEIDLYIPLDADADPDVLPRRWMTKTGMRFARANNFDYAAATKAALGAVFANSICANHVEELSIDDVILVGRETEVWGVVKIVGIFDEPGCADDCYLLNVKVIDRGEQNAIP